MHRLPLPKRAQTTPRRRLQRRAHPIAPAKAERPRQTGPDDQSLTVAARVVRDERVAAKAVRAAVDDDTADATAAATSRTLR